MSCAYSTTNICANNGGPLISVHMRIASLYFRARNAVRNWENRRVSCSANLYHQVPRWSIILLLVQQFKLRQFSITWKVFICIRPTKRKLWHASVIP